MSDELRDADSGVISDAALRQLRATVRATTPPVLGTAPVLVGASSQATAPLGTMVGQGLPPPPPQAGAPSFVAEPRPAPPPPSEQGARQAPIAASPPGPEAAAQPIPAGVTATPSPVVGASPPSAQPEPPQAPALPAGSGAGVAAAELADSPSAAEPGPAVAVPDGPARRAVSPVAEEPLLRARSVVGAEDSAIALDLSAALSDTDGSETLALTLRGVPVGATLSAGTRQPDGSWSLTLAQLAGLTLTPPRDFAGTIDLTLRATGTEAETGGAATTEHSFTVQVAAVVDGAALAATASGIEDRAIPIVAEFGISTDLSEQWEPSAIIRGVPTGAVLSQGLSLGGGAWQVDRAALVAGRVAIIPPADSDAPIALTIEARMVDSDGAGASQLFTAAVTVQVAAVADAPMASADDATGAEDSAIALNLAAGLTDTDGSETLALILRGMPDGAALSAGVRQPDGSWSLTSAQLAGLTLTPPRDFAGTIALTLRATSSEARNGDAATLDHAFAVQVGAVADAPSAHVGDVSGAEDSTVALDLSAALTDTDGSETLTLALLGLPAGFALSAGAPQTDGSWVLTSAQLAGLAVTPPHDFAGTIALTLRTTAREAGGDTAMVDHAFTVHIAAVADAPMAAAADVAGAEDSAIALDLAAALADTDGSETLSLALLGVPVGATLSAGTRQADGSWSLRPADLAGLTLTPPHDFAGSIALTLRATSTEAQNADAATVDHAFAVQVAAVVDGAALAATASGLEDRAIPIVAQFGIYPDASEQWEPSAIIRGVPAGAVLSQGLSLGGGAWQVSRVALAAGHIAITPPADSDAPIALSIEARMIDTDGAGASRLVAVGVTVVVAAVADAPLASAGDVTGAEDSAIALDLTAGLTDTDGSETLALALLGVPAGASLSAGIRQPDGSWSLTSAQLAGLTLTPPRDFAGSIALTLRATSTEIRGGGSAVTIDASTVHVTPRADAALFTAGGDGAEDGWIPIRGTLATRDMDGSETLGPTLTITGVPDDALLSHGTLVAPGTWSVAREVFEAGQLSIRPPTHSDIDVTLRIAVQTIDGTDAATTQITARITVRAAADAPTVLVADAQGLEDSAIPLVGLGGTLADTDGSETLGFVLSGVPQGATLSAGTRQVDGSWSLTPAQLATVAMTPPANFAGSIALTLTAVATEARDGRPRATTAAGFTVVVDPVADAGSIAGHASGEEDSWIILRPAFLTPDADGSETWSATTLVSGVPAGALLSQGTESAPGEWAVATADLRNGRVSISPPAHADSDFTLTLRTTLQDSSDGRVSTREVTGSHGISVTAVADAPVLAVADAAGDEDTAIALDLSAALVDIDGSEALTLALFGVPHGATLSAGTRQPDGSWAIAAVELPGLALTPPRDVSGAIDLTLRATVDDHDGSRVVGTAAFSVAVHAVADTPALRVGAALGAEDSAIALRISGAATDTDGSETLVGFRVLGLPAGAALRAGGVLLARGLDGSVFVAAADAATLNVTPPPDSDGDFTLRVIAVAEEPNGSRAESAALDLPVHVDAVADAPVWLRIGSGGGEDSTIPLDIAARLSDTDGSEAISFVVSGVPPGALLSAGIYNGPGSWSLTAADAATATLTPPADFSGTITLAVTAIVQEAQGGHTVLSTVAFPVHVAAAIDSTGWSAGASGTEDSPIALSLAPALRDGDGSEHLVGEALVEGVPPGGVLRLGDGTVVADSGGVHRIPVDRLAGVTLTMPADSDVAVQLQVRVTVEDTGGVQAALHGTITVDPRGVADTPALEVAGVTMTGHASGDAAEGWSGLPVSAALADTDGSETLHVWIRDVPDGFTLSAGVPTGDGAWLLRADALNGLAIRPPAGFVGSVALRVQAVAIEREGDAETAAATLSVAVTAAPGGYGGGTGGGGGGGGGGGSASGPESTLTPAAAREDAPAELGIAVAALNGAAIGIQVSNLPAGARLSAGLHDAERNIWVLRPDELTGLQVFPPRDFAGALTLRVTAVAVTQTGERSTTQSDAVLAFEAVADGAAISAAPATAIEDQSVPLNLGIAARDADGSESVVAITLSGLSPGAGIADAHGIHDNGDGTWTVESWAVGAVRLVPPPDAHGSFRLTVAVTTREATNGATATASRNVSVTVAPQADAPVVTAADAAGPEDQPVDLALAATLADRDGSEALSVVISGMPGGARLSAGINNGDGSWTLLPAQLAGLSLTPPGNWSGAMTLTLRAHAMERSTGEVATSAVSFRVSVTGIADAPLVDSAANASGSEDQAIALDILARLTDSDGSEMLTLVATGLPAGTTFSAGSLNPDGSWTIPAAALPGLSVTPPPHFSGTLDLGFAAVATERDGHARSVSFRVAVTVDPVADAPIIALSAISAEEDAPLRLPLSATLVDADGSESIARFVVAGLPPGALLSAGTRGMDGSWTLTAAEAADVSLVPAPHWSGSVDLTITAVSRETPNQAEASSTATLQVTVNAVADAPMAAAADVFGAEGSAIALDLSAALSDTDGSETLALTLLGVPDGATLSAGARQADGSWSLRPADLAGLTFTPPHDFAGSIALTLRATGTEAQNADAATTEHGFTVQVAAVVDGAALAATASGIEDRVIPILADFGASPDASEQWEPSAIIRGVPAGAVLSQGLSLGGGAWQVSRVALAAGHIAITPPADSDAPIALSIEARMIDSDGAGASRLITAAVTVQVAALADAPLASAGDAAGAEDTAIALDLTAGLTDTDGSETLATSVIGLPAGFTLSAGARQPDGSWLVPATSLTGLHVMAPGNWHGTLSLVLSATTQDGTATATVTRGFAVTVAPVNDAPELVLITAPQAAAGAERAAAIGDAAISDVDSMRMSGATITLSGGGTGERLVLAGYAIHTVDGQRMIGDTGIAVDSGADGTLTLAGAAPIATYGQVLEALSIESASGLVAGTRSIGVTLRDEAGATTTQLVALRVEPSVIEGGAGDALLAGTAGADTFRGGAGHETMTGGAGADLFIVSMDGSRDRVEGGDGTWTDTVHLEGAGAPGEGGWTLVLDGSPGMTQAADRYDFDSPVSGQIQFADGTLLELAQIERITW